MKLLQTGHFWVFQGGIAYILEQEYGINAALTKHRSKKALRKVSTSMAKAAKGRVGVWR